MTHYIRIWDREEIPEFCCKAGTTFADGEPKGHLAEVLGKEPVIWILTEPLYDEYGAFRVWSKSYYIPAPD